MSLSILNLTKRVGGASVVFGHSRDQANALLLVYVIDNPFYLLDKLLYITAKPRCNEIVLEFINKYMHLCRGIRVAQKKSKA